MMDYIEAEFLKCSTKAECVRTYDRLKNWFGAYDHYKARLSYLTKKNDELPVAEWYTLRTLSHRRTRKFRLSTEDLELVIKPQDIQGLENVLPHMQLIFDDVFGKIKKTGKKNSRIQIVFENDQLREPIIVKTMNNMDLTAEIFLNNLVKVLQSYQDFNLYDRTMIRITRFDPPKKGGGKNHRRGNVSLEDLVKNKRSIIQVKADGCCFGRGVAVAIAWADGMSKSNPKEWQKLRRFHKNEINNKQRTAAIELYQKAGIPPGPVSLDQVAEFSKALPGYKIQIWDGLTQSDRIYVGNEDGKELNLLLLNEHYHVVTKVAAFFGKKKQCSVCGKCVEHLDDHTCRGRCKMCNRKAAECKRERESPLDCTECQRVFWNDECYAKHKEKDKKGQSYCANYRRCPDCNVLLNLKVRRHEDKHTCGERPCRNCKKMMPPGHDCYIKRHTRPPKDNENFIVCDIEARFDAGNHVPIAAVAQYSQSLQMFEWKGESTKEMFCQWLLNKRHSKHTVLFHNLSGYDGHFIMNYLTKNKILPNVVKRGQKITQIYIQDIDLTIRDTLNFLLMPLSAMAESFGLQDKAKGFFPHLFSKQENYTYNGVIPAKKFFMTNGLSDKGLADFHEWHDEQSQTGVKWEFWPEMMKYCKNDVEILTSAVNCFSKHMEEITRFNPFVECSTLPGFTNEILRADHIPDKCIALLPQHSSPRMRQHSAQALQWLHYVAVTQHLDIKHERNNVTGEVVLKDNDGKSHKVDGYAEQDGKKLVFEFNGCYWHGCPSCYDADERAAFGMEKNDTLYKRTVQKRERLEAAGYEYTEIWSHQFECLLKEDDECRSIVAAYNEAPIMRIRDVLRGGRCEAFKLLYEVKKDEKITYMDVNSLYPSVFRGSPDCPFPIGLPVIINKDFEAVDKYFGVAHVRVLAPKRLDIPVLPLEHEKKVFYALCRSCAVTRNEEYCSHTDAERSFVGVYTTPELSLAVSRGYTIEKFYEVWHYPQSSSTLFTAFVDKFYKLKVQNSGWPKTCQTDDQRRQYLQTLKMKYGIELQPDDIKNNPTQRLIAKIILNSSWGRFALRPDLSKVEWVKENSRLEELLYSERYEVQGVDILCEGELLEVQYRHTDEYDERDIRSNVVLAGFVTSYARMVLYQALEKVGIDNLLYTDTDSVFAIERKGQAKITAGQYLGDFQSELRPGEFIRYFACGGPKCYAYETNLGNQIFKAKGVRIDQSNKDIFQLTNLVRMVKDPAVKFKVYNPFFIHRPRGQYELVSKEQSKTIQFTFNKRLLFEDYTTVPYGTVELRQPVGASFQPDLLRRYPGWEEPMDCGASSEEDD